MRIFLGLKKVNFYLTNLDQAGSYKTFYGRN
jgi:hypothetical protein